MAVESVDWTEFARRFVWRQGEHVTLIGPTGSGKTSVAKAIIPDRRFVLFVASKPEDENIDDLLQRGWVETSVWPPDDPRAERLTLADGRTGARTVLWPPMDEMSDLHIEAETVGYMLQDIYRRRNWCVVIDECAKVSRELGHKGKLRLLWQQGRSLGVTVVAATQRPVDIPLEAYSQASHLFLYGNDDDRDQQRLGEIGFAKVEIRETVADLAKHELLYVGRNDRLLLRTMPPENPEPLVSTRADLSSV